MKQHISKYRELILRYFPGFTEKIFFLLGIIMFFSEIIKQLLLTFCLGRGQYNWWYFPFQLCSIPMYLLLAYPWIQSPKGRDTLLCFLMCYGLLGGIAVFADTSGLHYPLPLLTFHSYAWHVLLIAIGIMAGSLSIRKHTKKAGAFLRASGLYLLCCAAAEILNLSLDRFGTINMFYINPHYRMQQIIFHDLSLIIGNLPAILIYIIASMTGAFLLFLFWRLLSHALFLRHPGRDL